MDSTVKIIEPEPGSERCDQHNWHPPVKIQHLGTREFHSYDPCPTCTQEQDEAKQRARERERVQQAMGLRRQWAVKRGLPEKYVRAQISDFKATTPAQEQVKYWVEHYAGLNEDAAYDKHAVGWGMIFVGNVGTGKTLLACALLNEVAWHGAKLSEDFRFTTVLQLLRKFKLSWRKDSEQNEQQIMDEYSKVPLLVIDEIGVQFGSDTERMLLTELINERYNRETSMTILISNLPLPEFTQVVGERVVDRFKEGGKVLVFDWASHRKPA